MSTTMSKVSTLIEIPEGMFAKSPYMVSRLIGEVTGWCDICGSLLPLRCKNGYLRQECSHQREVRYQANNQQSKPTMSARCYCWLGKHVVDDLAEKTFDNFYPDHQPNVKEFRGHLATARKYADQIVLKQPVGNLLMVGGYGTGKTHLAAAILNHLRENRISCLFCTVQDLFDEFYSSSFMQQQEIITQASSTSLLVFDDLDKLYVKAETDGAFQKKRLFSILKKRYKRHLPTIVTTNVSDDLSQWLDGATMSRLSERLALLVMNGRDYRARGQK